MLAARSSIGRGAKNSTAFDDERCLRKIGAGGVAGMSGAARGFRGAGHDDHRTQAPAVSQIFAGPEISQNVAVSDSENVRPRQSP
jgi:hypothetical protein